MSQLYPLKFHPIFKEKIWGGHKIRSILGKDFGNLSNCGETWEISGVKGNISEVSNGSLANTKLTDLIREYKSELVGEKIYKLYHDEFPLLIKFIDAAHDLSIQVHPDDELAKKRHGGFGKTEMWYILQADEGASLITGFNKKTSKEEYLEYFERSKLTHLLNREKAEKGDVFFLPAGRIHTIGRGILLAEIQQTSDITYRIYDFDRVDKDGNKRELHVEEAVDAIDFEFYDEYKTDYQIEKNTTNQIISIPYFTTNKLIIDKAVQLDRTHLDCFKIYIGTEGSGLINGTPIKMGEVLMVPASIKSTAIEPNSSMMLLETYI
jgi:mannose-6-phosphate isomerase